MTGSPFTAVTLDQIGRSNLQLSYNGTYKLNGDTYRGYLFDCVSKRTPNINLNPKLKDDAESHNS